MTRRRLSDHQRQLVAVSCDDCGARPGEWCLADSGAWARSLHDYRIDYVHRGARANPVKAAEDGHARLMLELTIERFGPIPKPGRLT
jgi:hypothetical protein